jgi:hypothetical protein
MNIPIDLPPFGDELFEDFGNMTKYLCQKRPQIPNEPESLVGLEPVRKSIKELISRMSIEWLEEIEHSTEDILILGPSSTIRCYIQGEMVDALYNPTVGVNLISASFTTNTLAISPHAPTSKALRVSPRTSLKVLGIVHDLPIHTEVSGLSLNFHIFEIQDFNIVIGQPIEKFLIEIPLSGNLDLRLGRD